MKLADYFTWARLILVVPITVCVLFEARYIALVLYILAVGTDIVDGYIARKTKTASKAGALLDSRIDMVFGFSTLFWLLWLFPQTLMPFWQYLLGGILLEIISICVIYKKLGVITGMHLYSAKFFAGVINLLLPVLLISEKNTWFVWIVIFAAYIAILEKICYLLRGGKNLDAKWFLSPIR